jgi:hypothetical protein
VDVDQAVPGGSLGPGRLAWGRKRELEQREHGFYDADQMIVLVAGPDELPPFVVVNHEAMHAMLTGRSGLGLVEHLLSLLRWRERPPPGRTFAPALGALRGETEWVHEAAAWHGTVADTAGHENVAAPRAYRDGVDLLRKLLQSLPGWPGAADTASSARVAQAVGVHALSPPIARALLADGGVLDASGAALHRALAKPEAAPAARFRAICKALRGTPFAAVEAWARSVLVAADGGAADDLAAAARPAAERVAPVAAAYRAALADEIAPFLRAAAGRFPQIDLAGGSVEELWESFVITTTVSTSLDVYAQTCVLPLRHRRDPPVSEGPTPPFAFVRAEAVVVSRASDHGDQYAWLGGRADAGVTLFAHLPDGDTVVWVTSLDAARRFLEHVWVDRPIVASGIGYDYASGDFAGVRLLADLPHVVVRLGDFRSFWVDVALLDGTGLAGATTLEWLPMPFPRNPASPYGFLLLKGEGRDYPVLLNPIVVGQYERVAGVADALPAPGVRLVAVPQGAPYAWLGPMSRAVVTAGAIFESECE